MTIPSTTWPRIAVRVCLAALFFVSGFQKVIAPQNVAPMFTNMGLPAQLAYLVGAFEIVSSIVFVIGLQIRLVGTALAAWCIVTALIAHRFWIDPTQIPNFLKNVGLAGAFALFAMEASGSTARVRTGDRTI